MDYIQISNYLKAMAHPTRLKIIIRLSRGPQCVNDITGLITGRQANVSQHLSLLRLHGIVDCRQNGNMKCYFLKNPKLIKKILTVFQ